MAFTLVEQAAMESAHRQMRGWERRFGKTRTLAEVEDLMRDHIFDALCEHGDPDDTEGDIFTEMVEHAAETFWAGETV